MHCSVEPSLPVLVVPGIKDVLTNELQQLLICLKTGARVENHISGRLQRKILLGRDQLYHPLSLRQGLLDTGTPPDPRPAPAAPPPPALFHCPSLLLRSPSSSFSALPLPRSECAPTSPPFVVLALCRSDPPVLSACVVAKGRQEMTGFDLGSVLPVPVF